MPTAIIDILGHLTLHPPSHHWQIPEKTRYAGLLSGKVRKASDSPNHRGRRHIIHNFFGKIRTLITPNATLGNSSAMISLISAKVSFSMPLVKRDNGLGGDERCDFL